MNTTGLEEQQEARRFLTENQDLNCEDECACAAAYLVVAVAAEVLLVLGVIFYKVIVLMIQGAP
jgi:hypothetical protein